MQRSNIHPDPRLAMARYWRRCQLWHAARRACPNYETFRQSCGAIERAIKARLEAEFGTDA